MLRAVNRGVQCRTCGSEATHDALRRNSEHATRTGGEPMVITAEADESSLQAELVLPDACCHAQPHACAQLSERSLHGPRLTHQRPDHTVNIVQTYEDSWFVDASPSRPCHRPGPLTHTVGTDSRHTPADRSSRQHASEGCGGGPQSTPSTHGLALRVARGLVALGRTSYCVHAPCGAAAPPPEAYGCAGPGDDGH